MARPRFIKVIVSAMGVSLASQALAFVRQMLIAAYFGISRELDIYFVVYTVAAMIVFAFSTVFDSMLVPRLVRAREQGGEAVFQSQAAQIFKVSTGIGVLATVLMMIAVPVLTPLIGSGFDEAQRAELFHF